MFWFSRLEPGESAHMSHGQAGVSRLLVDGGAHREPPLVVDGVGVGRIGLEALEQLPQLATLLGMMRFTKVSNRPSSASAAVKID